MASGLTVNTEPSSSDKVMTVKTDKAPDWCSAKRRQILDGARKIFTDLGFERASVDTIAARAGVSKATVYNHFRDKSALFSASFAEGAELMRAELRAVLEEPSDDLVGTLQRAGERIVSVFVSPPALALRRNIGTEMARFPELGRALYENGPRLTVELIAGFLTRWAEEGLLRVEDPISAAVHFVGLCEGDLIIRTYLGVVEPTPELVTATVRRGVETFLRAYRA